MKKRIALLTIIAMISVLSISMLVGCDFGNKKNGNEIFYNVIEELAETQNGVVKLVDISHEESSTMIYANNGFKLYAEGLEMGYIEENGRYYSISDKVKEEITLEDFKLNIEDFNVVGPMHSIMGLTGYVYNYDKDNDIFYNSVIGVEFTFKDDVLHIYPSNSESQIAGREIEFKNIGKVADLKLSDFIIRSSSNNDNNNPGGSGEDNNPGGGNQPGGGGNQPGGGGNQPGGGGNQPGGNPDSGNTQNDEAFTSGIYNGIVMTNHNALIDKTLDKTNVRNRNYTFTTSLSSLNIEIQINNNDAKMVMNDGRNIVEFYIVSGIYYLDNGAEVTIVEKAQFDMFVKNFLAKEGIIVNSMQEYIDTLIDTFMADFTNAKSKTWTVGNKASNSVKFTENGASNYMEFTTNSATYGKVDEITKINYSPVIITAPTVTK